MTNSDSTNYSFGLQCRACLRILKEKDIIKIQIPMILFRGLRVLILDVDTMTR
jgi:hypothetical protein